MKKIKYFILYLYKHYILYLYILLYTLNEIIKEIKLIIMQHILTE
jgi:hypothetical protein